MRNRLRLSFIAVIAVAILSACSPVGDGPVGGRSAGDRSAGDRSLYDTRDLVVEAQVPESGFWYVAEATAADAVDDVMLDMAPMFEGDTPPTPTSGLAPILVSHGWPADQQRIALHYRVTSLDTAENAEVRCSVYFDGKLVVEDTVVGASAVAMCEGEFRLSDFE